MTFERVSPRNAFVAICKARWLFGDEAAEQCFNDTRAASQDVLDALNIFMAAAADGRIPIYDAISGERRFRLCAQNELIETFVTLMAEDAHQDPWPITPPAPLNVIDRSNVELFIATWLKEDGLDDMRLVDAPSQLTETAKDARRPQRDVHLDQSITVSPAHAINPAIERHLLRLCEVKRLTGLSKSAIYARMKDADFPKQKNLGPQTVAWWSDEVAGWISSRT